ncbi:VOC family protein [Bifidobacterium aquikefiri]|uniref:VOC family protein n=1 Tax=Bifidobacterium aquikefiri TaxID=1653207 RepID=UPI0023F1CDC4|nr:VOC family protein [Bifidobacterium aquikefiri]
MTGKIAKMQTCLWFDGQAEEAVQYYTSIFKDSEVTRTQYYTTAGQEIHGKPPYSVMTVEFSLNGMDFIALNGGPEFKFSEAISIVVNCDSQEDIDYYWDRLSEGGDKSAQVCGWLKDKYGLSWQIAPTELPLWIDDPHSDATKRVMETFMKMSKLDIATLHRAYLGE